MEKKEQKKYKLGARILNRRVIDIMINSLAKDIVKKYTYPFPENFNLTILCNLMGGMFFASDLIRELNKIISPNNWPLTEVNHEEHYIHVPSLGLIQTSSYNDDIKTNHKVKIIMDPSIDIQGKNVLVVDDIIDVGETFFFLQTYLSNFGPNSLDFCAFINKTERREKNVDLKFSGYEVPRGYLVGYGMGLGNEYRCLPEIYELNIT